MVAKFNAVMTKLDFLNKVRADRHISPYEALIVASIAQAEAGVKEDIPPIARVLYNRAYGGKFPCGCLQLDSTVNYWLRISGQTPKDSSTYRRRTAQSGQPLQHARCAGPADRTDLQPR